ncbi:Hypothetical protein, putative [Bodo saltans]|uniref:Uncharacterized protein n=1 Tax=Bodo saltans TaxID=75058 RepID=A0A0S4INM8_BODSA|nr:Hypothetical protein, putative [Bodo saltans]|eukprot:CUE89260.1 Hypothetical protein, putative [Bodo saltans]
MHVHHLPVRTTFRGTTDISVNFQQCIAPYDPTKKRPRGGDTPDASTTPPPAAASLGSLSGRGVLREKQRVKSPAFEEPSQQV